MVRSVDVARIVQLGAEMAEIGGDVDRQMRHVLDFTCRLLGAQVGAVAFAEQFLPGRESRPRYLKGWEGGWMGDAERAEYYRYLSGDHAADACVRPLGAVRAKMFTRYREQLVSDADWYALENVNESRRAAGVDAVMYSVLRTDRRGGCICFGVHRPWGDRRPFGEKERTLLHLCHRVIAPQLAYIKDSPADMRSAFPPRMRQALDLLLQGQGEKQIATVMGISRHTVHDLAKEIYRRVRVSSRAELMARFIDRDGATGRSAK